MSGISGTYTAASKGFQDFIDEKLEGTDGVIRNELTFSLSMSERYHQFLIIVSSEYDAAAARYIEHTQQHFERLRSGPIPTRSSRDENWALTMRVHWLIENMYIFAKLLLDRVADTFGYYFQTPWRPAGSTHSQLTSWFRKISINRQLASVPSDLCQLMDSLKNQIVDYRTVDIEHISEPSLFHGTLSTPPNSVRIYPKVLYPKDQAEAEKHVLKQTATPSELLPDLYTYMTTMLQLFRANADKSILTTAQPRSSPRA